MFPNLFQYLSAALGVAILALGSGYYIETTSLERDLALSQRDYADCKIERNGFISALEFQSQEITELEVDYNSSIIDLEMWRSKPPDIKYKTVYKYIPQEVNLTRGECNDTKQLIGAIRHIDFSEL